MQRASSRPPGRRRAGRALAAAVALGLALGALPEQALPTAHGDENMGICAPATNIGGSPAPGPGAPKALPAGAGFLLDPDCGDPTGVRETAPTWADFNSGGTPDTVAHLATGNYVVWFSGLAGGTGVPQVTAVGQNSNRCRIGGWGPDGFDEAVTVLCADAKGAPVDWEFSVSFTSEQTKYAVFGYLKADQPANAKPYQPTSQYAWNGAPATIQRTGIGRYTVTRQEPGAQGADLVSAYGTANGQSFCKLVGSTNVAADVACYNGKTPADTPFTLTYGAQGNLLGLPTAEPPSGYARVDTTTGPTPDPSRRWTSRDPGTGAGWSQTYDQNTQTTNVTMPLNLATGTPQVVAEGPDAASCAIAGDWTKGSIPVECWDTNGNPVRETFEVVYFGLS